MRKGLFSVLSSGAIVVALGIGTSMAAADDDGNSWTIKPGGSVTGTAGTTVVTDTATGVQVTCTSSSVTATFKSGVDRMNPLAKITGFDYNGCTAVGASANIATSASLTNPWPLRGSTYRSGVTQGSISNIETSWSITNFGLTCSGTVAGTSATAPGQVGVTYNNADGSLITGGGNLHAWNVTGPCFGLIRTGDPLTSVGTYIISPQQRITSS
jgi:hypothetical protein